jgi:hypothetical protein
MILPDHKIARKEQAQEQYTTTFEKRAADQPSEFNFAAFCELPTWADIAQRFEAKEAGRLQTEADQDTAEGVATAAPAEYEVRRVGGDDDEDDGQSAAAQRGRGNQRGGSRRAGAGGGGGKGRGAKAKAKSTAASVAGRGGSSVAGLSIAGSSRLIPGALSATGLAFRPRWG